MSPPPDLAFLSSHPFVRNAVIEKIYGCMIGSALGDTVGLYAEFLPKSKCDEVYGDRGFRLTEPVTEWFPDGHRNRFEKCAWTDDTDQALLILLSHLHSHTYSSTNLVEDFAKRLQIWISQGLRALDRPPCGIGALVGSVVSNKDYLNDPVGTATTRWRKTGRFVAPNGSLMRTHPIGIIGVGMREEEVWKLAADVGRRTHVDPRCVVSCCIVVGLIRGILRGEILAEADLDASIENAWNWVRKQQDLMNPELDPELSEAEVAMLLTREGFERHVYATSFEELQLDNQREMGYVYKCLGSAILTLRRGMRGTKVGKPLRNTLFEEIMTDLIMQGGDADTNATVAGALLGAWVGYSGLPEHWANGLAHREWLVSKIERTMKKVGIVNHDEGWEVLADEAPDGGKGLMNQAELERRDMELYALMARREQERKEKAGTEKKSTGKRLSSWLK